jgi:ABC-type lipoprotein release transport system permease subunit
VARSGPQAAAEKAARLSMVESLSIIAIAVSVAALAVSIMAMRQGKKTALVGHRLEVNQSRPHGNVRREAGWEHHDEDGGQHPRGITVYRAVCD